MKRLIRAVSDVLAALCLLILGACVYVGQTTPDAMNVSTRSPVCCDNLYSLSFPDSTFADGTGKYTETTAQMKLLDIIPVKDVKVTLSERQSVITGGQPFGIRLYTEGLIISRISSVQTSGGKITPADDAGLKCGDVILQANGNELKTNEQLLQLCHESKGDPVLLHCIRDGKSFNTSITPVKDSSQGTYRLGIWVRDSCAGIGTITFIDPMTKCFAGLGHGIYDGESGSLMPLADGDIVPADIISVDKGAGGRPGSLSGCFITGEPLGVLSANTECGLYGSYNKAASGEKTEIAFRQEVMRGSAVILSTVEGSTPKAYDIEIENISYDTGSPSKNMVIRITDKELIKKTGGIVKGMSGSPILQNGRLVGAVTHVFIDDPTHGYGVFAENMAEECNKTVQNLAA